MLLEFIEEHRKAVRFDLRSRLGIGLDDMGQSITFGEVIDHVETLILTPGSHTHAAVAGWRYPATDAELATVIHAEWFVNVHRDRKKLRDPIEFDRPWTGVPQVADVTDAEREQLRALLIASSPFAH